jgi:hypothetical protein
MNTPVFSKLSLMNWVLKYLIARHAAIYQALADQSVFADFISHRQHQQCGND